MPVTRFIDRDGAWLAGGAVISGLTAFAVISLGTRGYGAAAFAPVSIVWSAWAVSAAVLTFPVQHWTIREVRHERGRGRVRSTMARLAMWAIVAAVAATIGLVLLGDSVLRTSSLTSPLAIGFLIATAVPIGYVRGLLVGLDRYREAAAATGGENLFRLALGGVVLAGGLDVAWFVVAMASGPLILLLWPRLLAPSDPTSSSGRLRDVLELSAANGMAQLTLTGAPVVLTLAGGGDRQISALFATLSLARAPYLVAQGASMRLTAVWSDQQGRPPRPVGVALLSGAVALAAGLVGAVVGPWAVALLFGADAALSSVATGVIAAASALALGALVMTSLYTTEDGTRTLVFVWLGAVVAGTACLVFSPGPPLFRTLLWFGVVELTAVVFLGGRSR